MCRATGWLTCAAAPRTSHDPELVGHHRPAASRPVLHPRPHPRPRPGPSIREIGRAVGLSSPSSVHYQLRRLEQAGVVVRASGTGWRDYRLN
ncbi:LexA family protein [Streptomyces sp. NPDC055060]